MEIGKAELYVRSHMRKDVVLSFRLPDENYHISVNGLIKNTKNQDFKGILTRWRDEALKGLERGEMARNYWRKEND